MTVLILPPRYTPDSIALGRAAAQAGWEVERLPSWHVPPWLTQRQDIVLYGEPLFATVAAEPLGLALLEPPPHWLPQLPLPYRRRWIRSATLGEARQLQAACFVKPAADKCFPVGVYASADQLPRPDVLPEPPRSCSPRWSPGQSSIGALYSTASSLPTPRTCATER